MNASGSVPLDDLHRLSPNLLASFTPNQVGGHFNPAAPTSWDGLSVTFGWAGAAATLFSAFPSVMLSVPGETRDIPDGGESGERWQLAFVLEDQSNKGRVSRKRVLTLISHQLLNALLLFR